MKNLTYDQLIELAPKDRPFQIEVDNRTYWACIKNNSLYSVFNYISIFTDSKFTLIDPKYQKPEVLKVGQKVRIMESARDIGEYGDMIGKIMTIHNVRSDMYGVYYLVNFVDKDMDVIFPYYCVQPVEEEEVQEIPELGDTLEQLYNLVSIAQNLISKYKN
jgi:hypothetical protein